MHRPQASLAALLLSQLPAFSAASLYEDHKTTLTAWGAADLPTMCYSTYEHDNGATLDGATQTDGATLRSNCASVDSTYGPLDEDPSVSGYTGSPALLIAETTAGDIVGAYVSFGFPAINSYASQGLVTCALPGEANYPTTGACIENGSFLFGINSALGSNRFPVYGSYAAYTWADYYVAAFGGGFDLQIAEGAWQNGLPTMDIWQNLGLTYLCPDYPAGYTGNCPNEYLLGADIEPVKVAKLEAWWTNPAQPPSPPPPSPPSPPPSPSPPPPPSPPSPPSPPPSPSPSTPPSPPSPSAPPSTPPPSTPPPSTPPPSTPPPSTPPSTTPPSASPSAPPTSESPLVPPSTPPPTATGAGDPHILGAHGDKFDFKGEDKAVYAMFSARGFAVNARFVHDVYSLGDTEVHGSFITEAYARVQLAGKDVVQIGFNATRPDVAQLTIGQRTTALAVSGFGVNEAAIDQFNQGGLVVTLSKAHMNTAVLEVSDGSWQMVCNAHLYPYSTTNKDKKRLDISFKQLKQDAAAKVAPHGLVGQTFDGDNIAVDGAQDDYKSPVVVTKAMGEGAIEGSASDYAVATPFSVEFAYSRFYAESATPRDASKLTGQKKIVKSGSKLEASSTNDNPW